MISEPYDEGYEAYIAGAECEDNPYNWIDGHDMPPDEYYQWDVGGQSSYLQFNSEK